MAFVSVGTYFVKLNCVNLPATVVTTGRKVRVVKISVGPGIMRVAGRNGLRVVRPNVRRLLRRIIAANRLGTSVAPRIDSTCFVIMPAPFGKGRRPSVSCIRTTAHTIVPLLGRNSLCIVRSASPINAASGVTRLVFSLHPRLGSGVCVTCYPRHILPNGMVCRLIRGSHIVNNVGRTSASGTVRFCDQFIRKVLRHAGYGATRVYGLARGSSHSMRVTFTGRLSLVYSGTKVGI